MTSFSPDRPFRPLKQRFKDDCLSTSLAMLVRTTQVDANSKLAGRTDGSSLIYAAWKYGVPLTPFVQEGWLLHYAEMYHKFDGILCGSFADRPGHAMTKIGNIVYDPADGQGYECTHPRFHHMKEAVYYAWIDTHS